MNFINLGRIIATITPSQQKGFTGSTVSLFYLRRRGIHHAAGSKRHQRAVNGWIFAKALDNNATGYFHRHTVTRHMAAAARGEQRGGEAWANRDNSRKPDSTRTAAGLSAYRITGGISCTHAVSCHLGGGLSLDHAADSPSQRSCNARRGMPGVVNVG